MDVIAADESGRPVIGEKGELVCRVPFPSRPLRFWGDDDRSRYRAAYFERFPEWWTHGDYIEITGSVGTIGGIIVYGRSDATLNPGGVRIGTAEIYRVVERFPEVADSIAVGRSADGDVEVILFVVLAENAVLDEQLERRIRSALRTDASPRHVPARIIAIGAIPYTRSGKKVEIAVRTIVNGGSPDNIGAIANPESLDSIRRALATRTDTRTSSASSVSRRH
jgi:acetoacetyl-CoA synthetase